MKTTCIWAYPKPYYVTLPDWFGDLDTVEPTKAWAQAIVQLRDQAEVIIARGTGQAVLDQVRAGIDLPTDGEIARENYIHYHCRFLEGFDFEKLFERPVRNGNYSALLPTVRSAVKSKQLFLAHDYNRG